MNCERCRLLEQALESMLHGLRELVDPTLAASTKQAMTQWLETLLQLLASPSPSARPAASEPESPPETKDWAAIQARCNYEHGTGGVCVKCGWVDAAPSTTEGACCAGKAGCPGGQMYVDPGIIGCATCGGRARPASKGATEGER